jgi:predicted HicB family RNase H-like nuclease
MEKRASVITLRVPSHEAEAIREAAAKEIRSVNQWCRIALLEAANKTNELVLRGL